MCPACYAMQSRVNNTCPYCRVEFAPKVKKPPPLRIPIQEAESIVEDTIKDYYYDDVDDELVAMLKESGQLSETQINEIQFSVYCHLYQSSLNVVLFVPLVMAPGREAMTALVNSWLAKTACAVS